MATVKLGENTVNLIGELPAVGDNAPDFTYVKPDLSDAKFSDSQGKVRIIMALPSLDTGTCAAETRAFNEKLASYDNVEGIVMSKDLPFAAKRFCELEGITNVTAGSDFRHGEFSKAYNIEMAEAVMKGFFARAVWVVDGEGTIKYLELVESVGQEPDYDSALEAINNAG